MMKSNMYYVSKIIEQEIGSKNTSKEYLQIIPKNGKLKKDKKTKIFYIKGAIETYLNEGISQITGTEFNKTKPIRFEVHPKLPHYTIANVINPLTKKIRYIEIYRINLNDKEKHQFIKTLQPPNYKIK